MSFIQVRNNANTVPFIRYSKPGALKQGATIAQDAARVAAMAPFTVLSKVGTTGFFTPLVDVDPALVPGIMTCGAIGGTAAEFAAAGASSFGIAIDGEAAFQVATDLSGLDSVADTPGYLTCAALAVDLATFQNEANAQFGVTIDDILTNVTCDFSGIDTEEDTPGYWLCGANGDVIGNWDALTDAAFSYVVNGVAYDTGPMNLTLSVTFDGLLNIINYHLLGHATMTYSYTVDKFILTSNTTGITSSITIGAPAAGTDISAAGYLNQTAGAAVAGTGGDGTAQTIQDIINAELVGLGFCYYDGAQFIFVSRTAGELSTVGVLSAGAAGTDVSGAGFLNGVAGAATAGTGGEGLFESITDIINAELAGRATVAFDGDAFVFMSPTAGVNSAVAVLTAGTAGTDISGAAYLNGLTGTGTVAAGTGGTGAAIPAGIYIGPSITAAALVAADITEVQILIGDAVIDLDQLILEGSLAVTDVIPVLGNITIEDELLRRGIVAQDTVDMTAIENT